MRTVFVCGTCGRQYADEKKAKECEMGHMPKKEQETYRKNQQAWEDEKTHRWFLAQCAAEDEDRKEHPVQWGE